MAPTGLLYLWPVQVVEKATPVSNGCTIQSLTDELNSHDGEVSLIPMARSGGGRREGLALGSSSGMLL